MRNSDALSGASFVSKFSTWKLSQQPTSLQFGGVTRVELSTQALELLLFVLTPARNHFDGSGRSGTLAVVQTSSIRELHQVPAGHALLPGRHIAFLQR